MIFNIITIFPKIFDSYFSESILKRAQAKDEVEINVHDLRDYTTNNRKTVDDTPYGGGAGMVMKIEPLYKSIKSIKSKVKSGEKTRVILFSAKGKRFTQRDAVRLLKYENIIMICGRYEGIDERVTKHLVDEEISIGDFVLTGGEIPAMAVVDSVTRLIPGVLGNSESIETESHKEEGYLEFPQYTKPEDFQGWKVPAVLLGGNHKKIKEWREKNSKRKIK